MAEENEEIEETKPEVEPEGGGETGDVAQIVSEHAEGDERFENEMREFMKHIDAKISQLADAQAAIVSTARIDDNDADEDEHGNDAMDDGVLDLIIND
ncbi:hypothetical protein [Alistipes putredinis]|uniref:hypothetical protein n=1 Tax=Alistipes putredinis TaxID=28117 RepID=UPI003F7C11CB